MSKDTKRGDMLAELAVQGMQDKKAKKIVKIDLTDITFFGC